MAFLDLLHHCLKFLALGPENHVRELVTNQNLVGRNDQDFQLVDLLKLRGFRLGRAGHTGQFLVHPEVVLEGDGGQGLVFPLDFDPLFGFDGLVQPVAPAAAGHQAAREFIDDHDAAVFDHVVAVLLEDRMGFQPLIDMVDDLDVPRVVEILKSHETFNFRHAFLVQRNRPVLLVDFIMIFLVQGGDDLVDAVVLLGGLLGRAGDN